MEITGAIKLIRDTQEISDKFRKREIVLVTEDQYPQELLIEFHNDSTAALNHYSPGDMVRVSINLRGRLWISPQGEERYFNTIQGWRIDNLESDTPGNDNRPFQERNADTMNTKTETAEDDDLPF